MTPKLEMLKTIADYFEVTTDYLLERDNAKPGLLLSEDRVKILFYFGKLDTTSQQKIFGHMEGLLYAARNLRKIKSSTSKILFNHPKIRIRG